MPKKKKTRKASAFPIGRFVNVKKVRIRKGGKIDVILADSQMTRGMKKAAKTKRRKR